MRYNYLVEAQSECLPFKVTYSPVATTKERALEIAKEKHWALLRHVDGCYGPFVLGMRTKKEERPPTTFKVVGRRVKTNRKLTT